MGWAQLTMKYAGEPSVASSTSAIASPSSCPDGSRPSVSVVNEMTTGSPSAVAASAIPIASSAYVMVTAVIICAPAAAKARACSEW